MLGFGQASLMRLYKMFLMLYSVQVHLLRVDILGWFLKSAHIDFILMLERGSLFNTFHLSLIYAIINMYNDLNHISQLIRSIIFNNLILHMIFKANVKDVY
jgi:hypothetical protein